MIWLLCVFVYLHRVYHTEKRKQLSNPKEKFAASDSKVNTTGQIFGDKLLKSDKQVFQAETGENYFVDKCLLAIASLFNEVHFYKVKKQIRQTRKWWNMTKS